MRLEVREIGLPTLGSGNAAGRVRRARTGSALRQVRPPAGFGERRSGNLGEAGSAQPRAARAPAARELACGGFGKRLLEFRLRTSRNSRSVGPLQNFSFGRLATLEGAANPSPNRGSIPRRRQKKKPRLGGGLGRWAWRLPEREPLGGELGAAGRGHHREEVPGGQALERD